MKVQIKPIAIDETPITISTFKSQGWEKQTTIECGEKYHHWTLNLPKDNPDENTAQLISSANDEWKELGIKKGHYVVELYEFNGLGYSECEEEIEILYKVLTGKDIYDK